MDTKVCTVCKIDKPFAEYRKYGGRSQHGLRPLCKACQRVYESGWRSQSKESRAAARARRADKAKVYAQQYIARNRARHIVSEARRRCTMKGMPFDLDKHHDEIQARLDRCQCELTGLPLRSDCGGKPTFDTPSIDRINPAMGYVYSNIRIVCFAMNVALHNWGEDVLLKVLETWKRKREEDGK